MWERNCKEVWAAKNLCFWIMVLEKTFESPLDSKDIKQVNLKRNEPWIFIGRTDAEVEAPILWLPDAKSWLLFPDFIRRKPLMLGKIEGRGEGSNIGRHCWMASPTQWSLSKFQEMVKDRRVWCAVIHGVANKWKWLSDRTMAIILYALEIVYYICVTVKPFWILHLRRSCKH